MTRLILLLLAALLSLGFASAQDSQKRINDIKKNHKYIYAMGTSRTGVDDARSNAKDLLAVEVEQWLREQKQSDVAGYIVKTSESAAEIETSRGQLYRVFVYVAKNDIYPYSDDEDVEQADLPATTPQADSKPLTSSVQHVLSAAEQKMTAITTFNQLNDYINQGRADGSITDVGKYSNLPHTGTVYVFIHSRDGAVNACMRVEDGQVFNLQTSQADSITRFKGCGAIWIKQAQ